jgi:hypothetical protein
MSNDMKTILVALMGVALFTPAASAKHLHHYRGYYASGVPNYASELPNDPRPTGSRPSAPNHPRAYGETRGGGRVNPDEVPPLSPGGQGLSAEGRH